MNISLYIGSDKADFNEAFNVMFSIGDIRDLSFGNANKSYTLNLPLSRTNKRLLSFINQSDVKSETSSIGRLYLGEQLVISGTVKILSLTEYYAKVIITSDDWIDSLKNLKMSSLDLSASNHSLTHTNVENSWTASYPAYRYPMINFGGLMSGENGTSARWLPCDFIPMIAVHSLISAILAPHSVVSSWLAIAEIKDLFILGNEKIADLSFISNKELEVSVANDTDNQDTTSIPASGSGNSLINYEKVILSVETKDESLSWSNDTFTAPDTGTYKFTVSLKLGNNAPSTPGFTITNEEVTIQIVSVRGVTTTILAEVSAAAYSGTELIENITYTVTTDQHHLELGDEVSVLLYLSCSVTNGTGSPIDLVIGVKNSGSSFENVWTNTNRFSGINKSINLANYMPDMTQLEFLTAIKDMFNLRFFKDRNRNTIYIEPWDQFLGSTVIDLTSYIDFASLDTELISQYYNKKINFRYTDDLSDKVYEEYLKIMNDVPGKKELILTSNYAIKGIEQKYHPFSSILTYPLNIIGTWDVLAPAIWDELPVYPYLTYNRKVGFNTRIVKWDGLTSGLSWYFETESKSSYPKISSLTWDTIYSNYLMKFYHYINKGKLFTIRMKIKPMFLMQLFTVINTAADEGFRPTYKITINGIDNYFFLQKVTTDGMTAELELILKQ